MDSKQALSHQTMAQHARPLVDSLTAGAAAGASRRARVHALSSAKALEEMACRLGDGPRHLGEAPGVLPALVGALAAAGRSVPPCRSLTSAAQNSARALGALANRSWEVAARLGELPGALPALVATAADRRGTTGACAGALAAIASASPQLARRVGDEPGALQVSPGSYRSSRRARCRARHAAVC